MVAKILLQLDTDANPSSFDAVVAIDSGVDQLLSHGGINHENVTSLVHGVMFTRGGEALRSSAIFIGGSDVGAAERLAKKVKQCFFGPVRVSVLQDASGCNTTAAAAVLSAAKHLAFQDSTVCILGGTGPVGKRVAEMIAIEGGHAKLVSRSLDRATVASDAINDRIEGKRVSPFAATNESQTAECLEGCDAVIACGAEGVELLDANTLGIAKSIRVAIDLNAVPPAGIASISAMDKGKDVNGVACYGALGIGGLKMKIHRSALNALFERNDLFLDTKEILEIGKRLS